jgi:hypothetical protein
MIEMTHPPLLPLPRQSLPHLISRKNPYYEYESECAPEARSDFSAQRAFQPSFFWVSRIPPRAERSKYVLFISPSRRLRLTGGGYEMYSYITVNARPVYTDLK